MCYDSSLLFAIYILTFVFMLVKPGCVYSILNIIITVRSSNSLGFGSGQKPMGDRRLMATLRSLNPSSWTVSRSHKSRQ
jgi:spore maturation protein SpmA